MHSDSLEPSRTVTDTGSYYSSDDAVYQNEIITNGFFAVILCELASFWLQKAENVHSWHSGKISKGI